MKHQSNVTGVRVALLWRGDPGRVEVPTPQNNRLYPLFRAFADLNVVAEPVPYSDDAVQAIHNRLIRFDGVLVWVDPITDGRDRSKLDPMLRDLSDQCVWVSAHPDVIQKIGTKEVLFRTRHFGWGTDTHLYKNLREFAERFPGSLKAAGSRVLKQRRGNGGIGTWKVELAARAVRPKDQDPTVAVQEARRGSSPEYLALSALVKRCEGYFLNDGCLVDQKFQPRTDDGMVRCYLVLDEVVGFSTQIPEGSGNFAMAREKTMYEGSEARFGSLKTKMESDWVPGLQELFNIETNALPAVWDTDFFYGPKDDQGRDTYVLGEINVSAVLPFPPSAVGKIARASVAQMMAARPVRLACQRTPQQ